MHLTLNMQTHLPFSLTVVDVKANILILCVFIKTESVFVSIRPQMVGQVVQNILHVRRKVMEGDGEV